MRGRQEPQVTMLAFVDLEERVPADHPLRTIKALADEALTRLSPEFERMYADVGWPSIPPERLLKASLLIALYSVRSERAFCEELDYNLLFRWFLGMQLMERSFDATMFTKNRLRLLEHQVGQQLFDEVVLAADRRNLLSDEHFTVDGTLIEAAASLKSFKPRDTDPPPDDGDRGNPSVDFHGERRANATHQSTTDPEARLFRKGQGKEAKLVFMARALMENRKRPAGGLPGQRCHGGRRSGMRSPCSWMRRANAGSIRRLSARTRATTRGVAWGPCAPAGSPRTWRNTRAGAPALSMDARLGIAAMRSASV